MKPLIVSLILVLTLSACAQKAANAPATAQMSSKREVYYKKSATDKQMTRDLNICELKVFKSEEESDGQMHPPKPLTKKDCMHSLGYEVFYHENVSK